MMEGYTLPAPPTEEDAPPPSWGRPNSQEEDIAIALGAPLTFKSMLQQQPQPQQPQLDSFFNFNINSATSIPFVPSMESFPPLDPFSPSLPPPPFFNTNTNTLPFDPGFDMGLETGLHSSCPPLFSQLQQGFEFGELEALTAPGNVPFLDGAKGDNPLERVQPTLYRKRRGTAEIPGLETVRRKRINEVIVFDNKGNPDNGSVLDNLDDESGAAFLMRILQYLETPQYLRKALFPMHNSLRFVGLLPPLDAPHHLRKHEWGPYREGVTVKERDSNSGATLVDVGLVKSVIVDQIFEPGRRVTVAMGTDRNLDSDLPRQVVSSSKPSEEGAYWGYQVRYAHNLSSVFKDCAYKGGYDFIVGTSEHGVVINSSDLELPSFRHLLIAFGGLSGLEESIEEDDNLKAHDTEHIFNLYLNTCPNQGSRTIRTEEAIFISLQYFQEPINRVLQG